MITGKRINETSRIVIEATSQIKQALQMAAAEKQMNLKDFVTGLLMSDITFKRYFRILNKKEVA